MNLLKLSLRNFSYYWRSHLGVILGVAVSTMVLTGALIVGDCVKYTLRSIALNRLGNIQFALSHQSRFVRQQLAADVEQEIGAPVVPAFQVKGMIRREDGTRQANQVFLYGVNDSFWQLNSLPTSPGSLQADELIINAPLADRLGIQKGDTVIVRFENPSSISRDVPLTTIDDLSSSMRLTVREVVDDTQLGRFDLRANQTPPFNAFLSLPTLQNQTKRPGKVNMLLVGESLDRSLSIQDLLQAMQKRWTVEDFQLQVIPLQSPTRSEIRTDRIFIEPNVLSGVKQAIEYQPGKSPAFGILTYFVNSIQRGDQVTPYSMVSAIEINTLSKDIYPSLDSLQENEILINQWLADDVNAQPGDTVTLTYNVLGPMRRLVERRHSFVVKAILPMNDPLCDRTLMPDFPGISKSEHCRDWDPGFIIDLERIRKKDESYWDTYRGTPKAIVSLQAGQPLWGNRYGKLTAIRFPHPGSSRSEIEKQLSSAISPLSLGLSFVPVRDLAMKSVDRAMNFSPLFIGLSFFLIAASLILTSLLFLFGLEQRSQELGILRALGFTPRTIRSLFLCEATLLSAVGGIGGVIAAVGYAHVMVWALTTVWQDAVAGIPFQVVVLPSTIKLGYILGILMTVISIGLGMRKLTRSSIHNLLSSKGLYDFYAQKKRLPSKRSAWLAGGFLIVSVLLYAFVPEQDAMQTAGKFFGVGTCLLIASLAFCHVILVKLESRSNESHLTLRGLGIRNNTRRRSRSLAVIALLACGGFLVIAVGANKQDASLHADARSSGTGGYTFWGETTIPLLHDLNTEKGCNAFGLSREDVPRLKVVPLRFREGDDASCLNLNRAQKPKIIGVNPSLFADRKAFQFTQTSTGVTDPQNAWMLLNQDLGENVIPAIADQASAMWALGLSIGDSIDYEDDQGNEIHLQLVGMLANSIFQGNLLIAENRFMQRFTSIGGYRLLLVDVPPAQQDEYQVILSHSLQDIGLELTPCTDRLAAFYAVENTYLSIFLILGGLGLILGCVGLGVVVMRNILERRGEIGVLKAMGFQPSSIQNMILFEHAFLLLFGIGCGALSGFVAVLPTLWTHLEKVPYVSLLLTLALMTGMGFLWIYLSAHWMVKEKMLSAIRSE